MNDNCILKKYTINKIAIAIFMFLSLIAIYPNNYLLFFVGTIPKLIFRCFFMISIIIAYFIMVFKEKKINVLFILAVIFSIYQILITYINKGDIKVACYSNGIIAISCLIMTLVFIGLDKHMYIIISLIYFYIIAIINLASVFFLNENNFTTNWFIGNRNDVFKYFLPLLFFTMLINIYDDKKKMQCNQTNKINIKSICTLSVFIITLVTAVYSKSASTSLMLLILIPYFLFFMKKDIPLFNIYAYSIVCVLVFCIFVLPGTNGIVARTISKLLGKGDDASYRLIIYDDMIKAILGDKTCTGHGILYNYAEIISTGNGHGHSTFLEIVFRYGIIGLVMFLFQYYIYIKTVTHSQKYVLKNLSSICMFVLLIWSVANTLFYYQWLYFLGIFTYFIGEYDINILNAQRMFKYNE